MESVKQGSSSVDYSQCSDQTLVQREGQLERQKNRIENPLSSWTVVHETDSWLETIGKVALQVITLRASVGIPRLLEYFFHKPDKNELHEIQSEINAVATEKLSRVLERQETTPNTPANSAPVSESPKVKPAAPIDIDAARAKKMRGQIERDALRGINSVDFQEKIQAVVKDDVSASMITAYIQGASSIDNAIDTVSVTRILNPSQLKEVEKIVDEATSPRIITEFGILVEQYGLEFAQKVFPPNQSA
ncbi:MAG: hypothetical protein KFB93_05815 [Simkaniaceae bacterium]|nr:MAG: hypothetical protein KFB93_05815 [Simkaniaceae bacterium]